MSLADGAFDALLADAEEAYDEGSDEEIHAVLQRQQRRLASGGLSSEQEEDLRISLAGGFVLLHDHVAALEQYSRLRAQGLADAELHYWEAVSLFHLWRFDEARARLAGVDATEEGLRASVSFYEGLLWEFAGDWARADELFRAAVSLAPSEYRLPVRWPQEQVLSLLQGLMDGLPAEVLATLGNVQVSVAPLPEPAVHARPDVDPLVLVLYTGRSLLEEDGAVELPGRVEVFQRNIERMVGDEAELRRELEITLKHEIGHHLGWDEEDLIERGLG